MTARMTRLSKKKTAKANAPVYTFKEVDLKSMDQDVLYKSYKLGSKQYTLLYSNDKERQDGVARATLMSLDKPKEWQKKRESTIDAVFQDDNMLDDLAVLPEFWKETKSDTKGAAMKIQAAYIITDREKCEAYKKWAKKDKQTNDVVCLDKDQEFKQLLTVGSVTCYFEFKASEVGPNDAFVAQALEIAKRVAKNKNDPDPGERYSRVRL